MIQVSLKSFVETGNMGPVSLGMSQGQVQSLLGEPDDKGCTSRRSPTPSMWKYGDIELHFDLKDAELWLIHFDHFDVPSGGASIQLDPWLLTSALTPEIAIKEFELDELSLEDFESCHRLIVGVGAELVFDEDDRRLCAVSYCRDKLVHNK